EGARHVGRGPFPTQDDVGVAHILQEQRLSTGTAEVTLPWRTHGDRASRLAVSHWKCSAIGHGAADSLLVAGLGMVAALVPALIRGGRVSRAGDVGRRQGGAKSRLLERAD